MNAYSPSAAYTPEQVELLLSKCSSMQSFLQAHAVALKCGLARQRRFHAALLTLSALRPWGSLSYARAIFDATPPGVPLLCNPIIRAYSYSIFPLEAVRVYNLMCRRRLPPSNLTFPFLLKACGRAAAQTDTDVPRSVLAWKGAETHCRVIRLGFLSDQFVQNSLMFMYSQCGRLVDARRLFDEMSVKAIVSWNVMLGAYQRVGDYKAVDLIFDSMPEKNVSSWNSMITRHVNCNDMDAAMRMFQEMPERDAISWNSMIAGYAHVKDYNRALELFKQMQANKVKPTELTTVSVLGACAETGTLEIGSQVHNYLKEKGYKIEGYVGNALLDMYAKCGHLKMARQLFDHLSMKHVTCWNTMIVALAVHGHYDETLELFALMEREARQGVTPNRVTFLGVLIACSHNGLLREAQTFFHRMIVEYKIEPDIKHYGCMVDLLCRCELLEEAYRMIKEMPVKANAVLWKTVLGACRVSRNIELAEAAMKELAELGPLSDEDYVLMSNIYAEAERWEDVGQLRTGLIGSSISKLPGFSQIGLT